jgi:hypothetical protein
MSKILKLKLDYGLGCFLIYKPCFDYLLQNDILNEIYYSINIKTLEDLRETYPGQYKLDTINLAKYLFNDTRIVYIDDETFESISPESIYLVYEIPNHIPFKNDFFTETIPLVNEEYICFNVKLQGIELSLFEEYTLDLIHILKNSRYKIVLIGERSLTHCKEYKIHEKLFDSLYDKIMNENLDIIDHTHANTSVGLHINNINISLNICKFSKYNIVINTTGGLSIAALFDKTIGLCSHPENLYLRIYPLTNSIISFNIPSFLQSLNKNITGET